MKKTTVTVTITCDGHRYPGFDSACQQSIDEDDNERCLAIETTSGLTFMEWDDATAYNELTKTFHSESCACNYLARWLENRRKDRDRLVVDAEYPEVAPAPAFDPGPVVVTPILAGQQTGDEPQF